MPACRMAHSDTGRRVMKNDGRMALNICTYKREEDIRRNLSLLLGSKFFDENEKEYFGRLEIFIVDNASELVLPQANDNRFVHLIYNRNTGGSGGFQRGIEEIRKCDIEFTHVIFMDDDVSFELSCFYILFDFLSTVDEANADRPVAGRMLDKDNPNIQWTAAEKWNGGNIEHVEFLRDITDPSDPYTPGQVIYDIDADYGGWWFCCYPYSFVKENDVIPFFLHCDDVEYGLRYGKTPIIIEGVHVWHETWEKKMNAVTLYYDVRNPLFVNEIHGIRQSKEKMLSDWKNKIGQYHAKGDYTYEYLGIIGMADYLKGLDWLKSLDGEKHHDYLKRTRGGRIKNAISWRIVAKKLKSL